MIQYWNKNIFLQIYCGRFFFYYTIGSYEKIPHHSYEPMLYRLLKFINYLFTGRYFLVYKLRTGIYIVHKQFN